MNTFAKLAAAAGLALAATAAHAELQPVGPLDADGNGQLTEAEFAPIAEMGASFIAYDSDGDGLVSQPEYDDGVRKLADDIGARNGSSSMNERDLQKLDELTRLFDQENADRGSLLNLFKSE